MTAAVAFGISESFEIPNDWEPVKEKVTVRLSFFVPTYRTEKVETSNAFRRWLDFALVVALNAAIPIEDR